jgi:DNA repair protein RecO (recombination protein O)
MLYSTRGIVFHSVKYSESSVIVKIYTGLFGLQSYLFKGIRNPKSKVKPGLFQALTLLDLVVYHKEKHSLQAVKEIRLAHPYQTIPFDIRKSSVALFINELIYKAIREEEANPSLFEFLWASCQQLDETNEPVSNFHLLFAIQLCHYLGIFPQMNQSPKFPIFNLREGLFQSSIPEHPHYLDQGNSLLFNDLLETCNRQSLKSSIPTNPEICIAPFGVAQNFEPLQYLKPETRNRLLETILLYYQLHLPGFRGLQSHHILRKVLS